MGRSLEDIASACIDISDGLAADLSHILQKSGVAAELQWDKLPFSVPVKEHIEQSGDWAFPITAGDDYELCFTVPQAHLHELEKVQFDSACSISEIGEIRQGQGLRIYRNSELLKLGRLGYQHFNE